MMVGVNELTMNTILDPDLVKAFLPFTVEVISGYAKRLFDAGADMVCMLEPTAMMISPEQFDEFSLAPFREIQEKVDNQPLILHICGNTSHLIEKMGNQRSGSPQCGLADRYGGRHSENPRRCSSYRKSGSGSGFPSGNPRIR